MQRDMDPACTLKFTDGFRRPVTAASADQNVPISIPRENPEHWPPCFARKPKHRNETIQVGSERNPRVK